MRIHLNVLIILFLITPGWATGNDSALLSLQDAEQLALASDFAIKSSRELVAAQRDVVVYAQQLPDPKVKLNVQNLPTNTFRFNQEDMTQTMISVEQMFPPGKTLELKGKEAEAGVIESQAQVRIQERKLLQTVRTLWLEVYESEEMSRLLAKHQDLYKELLTIVSSTYRVGQVKQQDVVQVRVALANLEDAQGKAQGIVRIKRAELGKWLREYSQNPLPSTLPEILTVIPVTQATLQHPELEELHARTLGNQSAVNRAREEYKPTFSAEFGYGIRQNRPDMISFGVTAEIPILWEKRQDRRLSEQQKRYQASLYALQDRMAELNTQQNAKLAEAHSLKNRIALYETKILPELRQVTELTKVEYQTGRTELSAFLLGGEAETKAREELLQLRVNLARIIIELRYLSEEEKP